MKKDLGISGFPLELTLNPQPTLTIPAVPFSENPHSLGDKLVNHDLILHQVINSATMQKNHISG